jgi:hypothetical protein
MMRMFKSTATFCFRFVDQKFTMRDPVQGIVLRGMGLFNDKDHGPAVLLTGELSPHTTRKAKKKPSQAGRCIAWSDASSSYDTKPWPLRLCQLIGFARAARDPAAAHWERDTATQTSGKKHSSRRAGRVWWPFARPRRCAAWRSSARPEIHI